MHIEGTLTAIKTFATHTVADNFIIKTIAGAFVSIFGGIVTGNPEIINIILVIYFLDMGCGVSRALKLKQFSSREFFKGIFKFFVYFILIALGSILDKVFHTGNVMVSMLVGFIVITDSISILENLQLMGFSVPMGFIKFLRVSRDRLEKKFEESEIPLIKQEKKNDDAKK